MSAHAIAASLVACFACGGSQSSKPTKPPSQDPPEQPDLRATLNGERVFFASAHVVSRRDGRVVVLVSTRALSCEEALSPEPKLARDELRFALTLVPKLFSDGSFGWRVEGQEFENRGGSTNASPPLDVATIDPRPGRRSTIDVADGEPRKLVSYEETRTLVVWGKVDAIGCGEHPRDNWDPPARQPATLAVAGHRVPIAGAAVVKGRSVGDRSGRRLMLGTETVACGSPDDGYVTLTSIGDLELLLHFADGATEPHSVELDGDFIGEPGSTYVDTGAGLSITPMQWAPGATAVDLELGGSTTIASKQGDAYAVALTGKVRATVCPPPAE